LTGDIGYRDNKNNLFIVGRNDDIINKGGVKIAPKEIENIIFMLDGIKDAVVLGEPCSLYNEKIRACIVKKSDTPLIDQSYIQTFLRQHISAYKIPDTIEFYEVLPRNANGKIDKQALLIKEKTI
jgi:acyl-CoA synthetase (AMP-forming)/AMP-acid ligase II